MILRKYYPTIVLSDIHLGSEHSRTEEVTRFLKHVDCDRLILNGDIIDGWQLKKSGKRWKQKHTDFFKVLMKMMEKRGTEIIYVVGNHDDFLDSLAPFKFSNISIVKDYLLKTRQGKRYFVTHGDIFDTVTTHMRWLAMLGDMGYTFLLWLNKVYNHRRERQGKPYFSSNCEIFFNISHSSNYVACVIGNRPVGIDIEKARKGRQNLAKRFFDVSEAEWIKECDSDQRFFRIWTLKEAYGKATGQGVLDILDKIVYRLEKGKMNGCHRNNQNYNGLPQNFTIVEKEVDGFSLSVIQL